MLDLVGRVGFGELRQVKRIAVVLCEFFEPRRAAGNFVFNIGQIGMFGHSSIYHTPGVRSSDSGEMAQGK